MMWYHLLLISGWVSLYILYDVSFSYWDWGVPLGLFLGVMKEVYYQRALLKSSSNEKKKKQETPQSIIVTSSIDIPSGGGLHKLSLEDDVHHSYRDETLLSSTFNNPFLKQSGCTASEKTHLIRNPSLIKESHWKKIAIATGKPFQRQMTITRKDHEATTFAASSPTFRDLLQQHQQKSLIAASSCPWPSSIPSSLFPEKSNSLVIKESTVGPFNVDPVLHELQTSISGLSVKEEQRSRRFHINTLLYDRCIPIITLLLLLVSLGIVNYYNK
jgi:hypothetical protein